MNGLRRDCVNKCKDSQGHSCINNDSERCLPFVPLTGCRHGSASLLCGESSVNNSRRVHLTTVWKVYLFTGARAGLPRLEGGTGNLFGSFWLQALA